MNREFSGACSLAPERTIDNAAPDPMRIEYGDLVFRLAELNRPGVNSRHAHMVIGHSLGVDTAGNPMSGYRYAGIAKLRAADWRRFYDVVLRLVPEFLNADLFEEYRAGVNVAFAAHGVVWDLDAEGRLVRVLPTEVTELVVAAIQELSAQQYSPALAIFNAAKTAYDDHPRRDREVCANVFDALESVAKAKHGLGQATFGDVLQAARQRQSYTSEVIAVMERVNTLRNRHFGHGMAGPFALTGPEVDFTYLSCLAGILLIARTP